jgi:hypothetical protein
VERLYGRWTQVRVGNALQYVWNIFQLSEIYCIPTERYQSPQLLDSFYNFIFRRRLHKSFWTGFISGISQHLRGSKGELWRVECGPLVVVCQPRFWTLLLTVSLSSRGLIAFGPTSVQGTGFVSCLRPKQTPYIPLMHADVIWATWGKWEISGVVCRDAV